MSDKNGVVGGVCMAHAPQFFTLPESEDKDTIERVRRLAAWNSAAHTERLSLTFIDNSLLWAALVRSAEALGGQGVSKP